MTTTIHTHAAVSGCTAAIDRCVALTAQIDRHTYQYAPEGHGSIGEHLRHCVDHFDCFFHDYESGVIDYDARARSNVIETDPTAAGVALQSILRQLSTLTSDTLDRPVVIRQTSAPNESPIEMQSTLSRELVFLSGHTVHHLALMVLIAERAGAAPSTELGVAYSTAAHRAAQSE